MREIEFRGKEEVTKEWVYGDLISNLWCNAKTGKPDTSIIPMDSDITEGYEIQEYIVDVIPETVGQFTGLNDKNGKKIFEGDILSSSEWSCLCEVIWNGGGFTIKQGETTQNLKTNLEDYYGNEFEAEIVGNIHDNPELLEVQNE